MDQENFGKQFDYSSSDNESVTSEQMSSYQFEQGGPTIQAQLQQCQEGGEQGGPVWFQPETPQIKERNVQYLQQLEDIKKERLEIFISTLKNDLKLKELDCKDVGEQLYYDNQKVVAEKVVKTIFEHTQTLFQLVIGPTQTGKTACMIAIIDLLFKQATTVIDPQNIFIITGISSNDWKYQMKQRFPSNLQDNVYHNNDLKKLRKRIQKNSLRDICFILDEVHVATKQKMTIDTIMKDLGFNDINILCERNINFVEFSATPNNVLKDLKQYKEDIKELHTMEPGKGYFGLYQLLQQKRVFQAKDLFIDFEPSGLKTIKENEKIIKRIQPAIQAIKELKEHLISYYGMENPKYHIIRAPNGAKLQTVMKRFRQIFGTDKFDYKQCHSQYQEQENINEIISQIPRKHTFIFIKEHLRCAVTLKPKQNLGILYERKAKNISDDVMVQGLAGRATGYDVPEHILVYSNIKSLETYVENWNQGFQSNTMKLSNSKKGRGFQHPENMENLDSMSISTDESNEKEPVIKKFKTQEEVKQYYNNELKPRFGGRGPVKRKPNEEGYYTTYIGGSTDKIKPHTTDEIYQIRKFWLKTQKTPYRMYPCYRDINDKSTLEFWIIHY